MTEPTPPQPTRLQRIARWLLAPATKAQLVVLFVALILAIAIGGILYSNAIEKTNSIASDSAKQRVKTVEQRCNLTRLLIGVLERDDPQRLPPFRVSYAKCNQQLVTVKAIARRAR